MPQFRRFFVTALLGAALILIGAAQSVQAQSQAQSQGRAVLIADTLRLTNSDALVAEHNVEISYKNYRLNADLVIYDQALDRLTIQGPFTLDTGSDIVIMASAAELSGDLRNGIIRSARMVMNQQLQISAATIQRVDGRYRVLTRVAASSCKICASSDAPLWEVRASRVIHDETAHQLYFDNAQFRVGGIPVMYLPRLRLPDPSLKRTTGFLVPRITANSSVGYGIKFPYFITLGDHADLTVTPFASDQGSRSLNFRYRQAYRTGQIELTGSYTRDQVISADPRGYLLAKGAFDLPFGYTLTLRGETVSDASYFRGYGLTEKDRLVTFGQVQRTRRDETINGRILGTHSIRSTENNATQPSIMADADWQHRYDLGGWGDADLMMQTHARQRGSTDPLDGSDPDTNADGRDVLGYGIKGDWQRNFVLGGGVLANLRAAASYDAYSVSQDSVYAGDYSRLHSAFGAELRWPLVKSSADGTVQVIEPIGQIVMTPQLSSKLFNEDSALVEFDEGNLFALNRFPGSETVEAGLHANLGVNYQISAANGRAVSLTLGRVLRRNNLDQFSNASGLGGTKSNWLAASQIDLGTAFGFTGRVLFDDNFAATKTELRSAFTGKRDSLSLGYLFAPADADEGRSDTISELSLYSNRKMGDHWTAGLASRYDFVSSNTAKASMGLTYRNECLLVDLSLSHSFASSTNIQPSTDFGLSVEFLGFGGSTAGPAQQCRR